MQILCWLEKNPFFLFLLRLAFQNKRHLSLLFKTFRVHKGNFKSFPKLVGYRQGLTVIFKKSLLSYFYEKRAFIFLKSPTQTKKNLATIRGGYAVFVLGKKFFFFSPFTTFCFFLGAVGTLVNGRIAIYLFFRPPFNKFVKGPRFLNKHCKKGNVFLKKEEVLVVFQLLGNFFNGNPTIFFTFTHLGADIFVCWMGGVKNGKTSTRDLVGISKPAGRRILDLKFKIHCETVANYPLFKGKGVFSVILVGGEKQAM